MKAKKLRAKDLVRRGFTKRAAGLAINVLTTRFRKAPAGETDAALVALLADPDRFVGDADWDGVARAQGGVAAPAGGEVLHPEIRKAPPPFAVFDGEAGIAPNARQQLYDAMRLPVAVAGALMPDAHHGYGLPIGGVLATKDAVIPYGVGVDIGCRMCLSVYDLPGELAETDQDRLAGMLQRETAFGTDTHQSTNDHPVLHDDTFNVLPKAKTLRGKAGKQLGSSGGGNHFVEFGVVNLPAGNPFGRPAGRFLALLSHSGSRGLGAQLAGHYTELAMSECRLPKQLRHLAWLDLNKDSGREYWKAMTLAGDYASACHDDIHARIGRALAEAAIVRVENHHNFAWKDTLADGTEVIVHRKGATPAARGELGIIPGSMADPGYIVRGLGNAASLKSASHGAGRHMSRSQAKSSITGSSLRELLEQRRIHLIGGAVDEAPAAYKDIRQVIAAQDELIEVLGTFHPKVVRMA